MLQTDTLLQQIDSSCNLSLLDELFNEDKLYQILLLDDRVFFRPILLYPEYMSGLLYKLYKDTQDINLIDLVLLTEDFKLANNMINSIDDKDTKIMKHGCLYLEQANYTEAISCFKQVILKNPTLPDKYVEAYDGLSLCCSFLGQPVLAKRYYLVSTKCRMHNKDLFIRGMFKTQLVKAAYFIETEQFSVAESTYQIARRSAISTHGAYSVYLGIIDLYHGSLMLKIQNMQKASEYLTNAYTILNYSLGTDNKYTKECVNYLALCMKSAI